MCPSAGDTLPDSLITALFEVLSFPDLMDDMRVDKSLESALLHLKQSHELALTDGGRYQGLYRLMAHPGPQVRAMVGACFTLVSLFLIVFLYKDMLMLSHITIFHQALDCFTKTLWYQWQAVSKPFEILVYR